METRTRGLEEALILVYLGSACIIAWVWISYSAKQRALGESHPAPGHVVGVLLLHFVLFYVGAVGLVLLPRSAVEFVASQHGDSIQCAFVSRGLRCLPGDWWDRLAWIGLAILAILFGPGLVFLTTRKPKERAHKQIERPALTTNSKFRGHQ